MRSACDVGAGPGGLGSDLGAARSLRLEPARSTPAGGPDCSMPKLETGSFDAQPEGRRQGVQPNLRDGLIQSLTQRLASAPGEGSLA